ncbi:MAG TPA: site-2 protease family protein, partial [Rectinemataceae bacterium]|nr:site-2 protease family protein [Rectinemataceae bacterium]
MLLIIILGLIGLGLVVVVHELGHFAAARAMGVEVEAFSVGWGPKLFGFRRSNTEWRISAVPIGGYCKMKGEESFRKALEDKAESFPREPGSFYGAAPWRRIVIAVAGPLANILFALLVFVVVSAVGYSIRTSSNRIVLASEYHLDPSAEGKSFPADAAGLKSGDRIISADGKPVADYSDVQETIALSADRAIRLGVERGGSRLDLTVTPAMDRSSGAGRIGVYSWTDPVVEEVAKGSAAAIAGIETGDVVTAIDGKPVKHAIEALSYLASKPERARFTLLRNGASVDASVVLAWTETGESNLGISFRSQLKTFRAQSMGAAIAGGAAETWKTFSISFKSLGLLFRGVDLLKAVSGPARITYFVGRSASEGMKAGSTGGLALPLNFLAFLSIGLFIMNLLPIPALDGGQVLLFITEIARRRPLRVITVYRFQFVG